MILDVNSDRVASPTFQATLLLSIFVFLSIIVMSFVFKVEVVARGTGRVVPLSRVQVVQSEFAGRVEMIAVRNGSRVKKGDTLIRLDPVEARSQLTALTQESQRLQIEVARIGAMERGLSLDLTDPNSSRSMMSYFTLPPALADHPFAVQQRELLVTEVENVRAAVIQKDSELEANRRSEEVAKAVVGKLDALIAIQQERLSASQKLLSSGTVSRAAYLDVQQATTELERDRDVELKQFDQRVAERSTIEVERRRVIIDIRSALARRNAEISSRLATLLQEERVAQRRLDSTRIVAPVSGIVDQLQTFTIGGVVKEGSEILRVVPNDLKVEIEAVFPNQDAGFLNVGQQSNIRLDAFPSERFGFLRGEVSDVAADSVQFKDGGWGYVVRINPKELYLDAGGVQHPLRPGMTATIDVVTDRRSIISYFFAPIVETFENSLGER